MSIKLIPILIFIALLSNILLDIDLVLADTLLTSAEVGDHPLLLEYDPDNGELNVLSRDSDMNYTKALWAACVK